MGRRQWWQRWADALVPAGGRLSVECEAFLDGTYLSLLLRGAPRDLPGWVWLNALAHGTLRDVVALSEGSERSLHQRAFGWYDCRATIAAELRETVGDSEEGLRVLQRDVLVPLELSLFDDPTAPPAHVARSVLTALRAFPRGLVC